LDVSSEHACFSKQEHKNGIASMGGRIELDIVENMWMS